MDSIDTFPNDLSTESTSFGDGICDGELFFDDEAIGTGSFDDEAIGIGLLFGDEGTGVNFSCEEGGISWSVTDAGK